MRFVLPLLLCTACSAESGLAASTNGTQTGSYTSTATPPGDTGLTTPLESPEFFAVDGSLVVVDGDIDPALSAIDMDYRNSDGESVCTGIRPMLDAVTETNTDPDLPLHGWWTLELDLSPCGALLKPNFLTVGLGDWDPQLDAAAASQNLTGANLYGLYAQQGSGAPVFVFGASGTSEQLNDLGPAPVTAGPIPDGTYQLRTLFLLPLAAR